MYILAFFWHSFLRILTFYLTFFPASILSFYLTYSDILCVQNYVRVVCQGGMHPQVTITACNWEQTT